MRRGFAIVELPLAVLFLIALVGIGLVVSGLMRHGELGGIGWTGAALIAPLALFVFYLALMRQPRK
jgi:hypothetical protein